MDSKEEVEAYEVNTSQRDYQVKPELSGHLWKQRGLLLTCTSCPFEHGIPLEPNQILTKNSPNGPVIERI